MATMRANRIAGPAGILELIEHLPGPAPEAIAIVAHPLPTMGGTMNNKVVTTLAKAFVELGFVAFRFNFRGVGGSEGKFDAGSGEQEDALAVIDHARQAYGSLPLILAGFSFGGFIQACVARQLNPQPDKLVLAAPAVGRYEVPHVPGNTLLVHGELDDIVPLNDVLSWARPQHLPVVVLPDTEHFFHGRLNQLKEIVLNHFKGQKL